MTDKLTDKEIVKALECCMNGRCDDDCPFRETCEHCHNLDSLILDLINRLTTERNNLAHKNGVLVRESAIKQAEIERLNFEKASDHEIVQQVLIMLDELKENIAHDIKLAKTEAYKEFWNSRPERLNEKCEGKEEYNKGWNACLDEFWDIRNNLLKELVGEDNG